MRRDKLQRDKHVQSGRVWHRRNISMLYLLPGSQPAYPQQMTMLTDLKGLEMDG